MIAWVAMLSREGLAVAGCVSVVVPLRSPGRQAKRHQAVCWRPLLLAAAAEAPTAVMLGAVGFRDPAAWPRVCRGRGRSRVHPSTAEGGAEVRGIDKSSVRRAGRAGRVDAPACWAGRQDNAAAAGGLGPRLPSTRTFFDPHAPIQPPTHPPTHPTLDERSVKGVSSYRWYLLAPTPPLSLPAMEAV